MSMFCLSTEEKWSSTCPRGSGKGGWADDDHRGLWCIPLPGGSKPLQGLHHCLPVMSFSSGHVRPPSLSFPHILALHQRVTPHLWLRDWKSLSPPAALGGERKAPGCSFLGWFLLPPHTSLRAPGILGSLVRPCHTTWTPHTSDDFWISLCPTHKWETRWRPWGKGLAMERMQWLKKPTAPRDGSATNLATEGHVLGAGTDVGWNCRTPPWAAVTHQAWLAGSRCGLGPWSKAKAHTAAEWPWPPSAGLQRHSRPLPRPEGGCQRWAGQVLKAWGGDGSWEILWVHNPAQHLIPLSWCDPQDGKNALTIRLLFCNLIISFFSLYLPTGKMK